MPVRINPCFGCPIKDGCKLRDDFRKRVAGLGLRSATFRCAQLAAALEIGTRIVIKAPFRSISDGYGEYDIAYEEVPATITSSDGNSFACIIDRDAMVENLANYEDSETDPDKVRFRRTMRHSRILRFLNEPKRAFCESGNPLLPGGGCDQRQQHKWACEHCSHNKQRLADKVA